MTLVLVDASVWIRALHGRTRDAALRTRLDHLLSEEQVARHAFVYGELLVGDRDGRPRMLSRYLHCPEVRPVSHESVVAFVRARRLMGRGLSWIDCHLLAAAVVHGVWLWSTDAAMMQAAQDVSCAIPEER